MVNVTPEYIPQFLNHLADTIALYGSDNPAFLFVKGVLNWPDGFRCCKFGWFSLLLCCILCHVCSPCLTTLLCVCVCFLVVVIVVDIVNKMKFNSPQVILSWLGLQHSFFPQLANGSWLTSGFPLHINAMFARAIIATTAWQIWTAKCFLVFRHQSPNFNRIPHLAWARVLDFFTANALFGM